MKALLASFLLLPCVIFGQSADETYGIYSQYLKIYQAGIKTGQVNFVIRETADYMRNDDKDNIQDVPITFREYLAGDAIAIQSVRVMYKSFIPILIKDTLWVPLIMELRKKIENPFIIKKRFTEGLQTSILSKSQFNKYFHSDKHIEKNWKKFHRAYPDPVRLIELSEIASDGQRAVFYFSSRRGGLGGEGSLILFYKENSEWKFLQKLHIWYS